jgi:hypothetical protein
VVHLEQFQARRALQFSEAATDGRLSRIERRSGAGRRTHLHDGAERLNLLEVQWPRHVEEIQSTRTADYTKRE